MSERLPEEPLVVDMEASGRQSGRYGGALHSLVTSVADTKLLVVYGYARLVGYGPDLELRPDILSDYSVEEGRIFTFKLRKGHRWSDGHPFTSEDFRYFWEDVALNPELSPGGPPAAMRVNGELPKFEVLDSETVRYTWSAPNPRFLPRISGAYPLLIYRPAHYLKNFHEEYAGPEDLASRTRAARVENWAALHERRGNLYRLDNPDLPTLQPWVLRNRPPTERFHATRNPYFHRVDASGKQLPYIDEIFLAVTSTTLIPAKASSGGSDLQARGLNFADIPLLRLSEESAGYRTLLWDQGIGTQLALYPNLNTNDPVWRELFRDVRFRRALSMGIDRELINQVLYFGLAVPSQNTVLPASGMFDPSFRERWAQYDPAAANALLDELGLTGRDRQGTRLLPDGRPMHLIVETAGESDEQTDTLELIGFAWESLGIKTFVKPRQRDVVRGRISSGETLMSVWTGLSKAVATPGTEPEELAPHHRFNPLWPKWGAYEQSDGNAGEATDLPEVRRLLDLLARWNLSVDRDERQAIWREMLEIHADQVFTLGTVSGVPQPIVVSKELVNLPSTGIYAWYPGANFGMYGMDGIWFDN